MLWNAIKDSEQAARSESQNSIEAASGSRILVIDDDPHFLRVLQRILAGEKFAVVATSNPCEAVELLRSNSFDLIICDLRMPDCDGLNLLQGIRSGGIHVPVIILTAYGEVDTYLEAMNAGATEYLNKPINSDELLHVVRNCLLRASRNSKRSNNT
jgi:DNA-binding NtrC family response regulator